MIHYSAKIVSKVMVRDELFASFQLTITETVLSPVAGEPFTTDAVCEKLTPPTET
jgi:hypothetical protein